MIAHRSRRALHVERRGRGQPLVLLHGWSMNLRVFDALAAQLESTFDR
jgi:pimeloyl-ACP methyl ester carboxylesterase